MDKCLLPAIREVITLNESQSWDFAYVVSLAKSQAIGLEGKQYKCQKEGFRQQIRFDLNGNDISNVWNIYNI